MKTIYSTGRGDLCASRHFNYKQNKNLKIAIPNLKWPVILGESIGKLTGKDNF